MEKVLNVIKDVLDVSESEITNISSLGGMTNINYQATVGNEKYIIRMPGLGTEKIINRSEEKKNLEIGVMLDINPKQVYFDTKTGLKITQMIPGAETLTPTTTKEKEVMKKVTDVLRKLHNSTVQMGNEFKLYELMEQYENNALEATAQFFEQFEEVKKAVWRVRQSYELLPVKKTPCHIDALHENFVMDENGKLYLIDWEYSGMYDPFWDLATHLIESDFTEREENQFLQYYFEREATKEEKERILIHKIFQDYLWSLWTIFKEAIGDDFGSYGQDRFERLERNLNVFEQLQSQKTVV
ncbi:choline/ethanolamine kinase family protein [Sporosarcina sp. G11-34]|uniref:choline/ethanolamine kinase family protein n=1 Tax=Sporosarcina sp. G11-34 TaxID=2849605 RepID=UPI0022A97526|nr:choline/ethanolamine kinase family protein [Sporosarcina sp. G11-34]MCZ2257459.1 phosphotransferase family protein [Sporosarcina sp. G11-34]